jgi:hypothetical protein
VVTVIPGGITDALTQLFGFGQPTYGFGLSLTLPMRNHAAAADYADALVQKKIDSLRVRTSEQNARCWCSPRSQASRTAGQRGTSESRSRPGEGAC